MPSDRLLALTLAIDDAICRSAWVEAQALFAERQRVLDETTLIEEPMLGKILDADRRLQERFRTLRAGILKQMTQNKNASAASRLYRNAGASLLPDGYPLRHAEL